MSLVVVCVGVSGCQTWLGGATFANEEQTPVAVVPLPAKPPSEIKLTSAEEPVMVRGQSPVFAPPIEASSGMSVSPWGATYVVPGEPSCSPEQLPVYQLFTPPPGVVMPYGDYPGAISGMAATNSPFGAPPKAANEGPGRAGWLDILPQEGGPISPDFGLPREAIVENRVANPLYLRSNNSESTWEILADELTKYFPIQTEQRIEQAAGVLTEGRFETPWRVGSTVLEPWKNDSVGPFNRWQSTLQTTRRKAIVRVIPAAGGYEIEVRVEKQLEDLPRPERASAGAASFRSDSALPTDRLNPIDPIRTTDRWISIGRDEPLEQEMLRRFRSRLTGT